MKVKQMFSLMMILVMLLGLLMGCSGSNTPDSASNNTPDSASDNTPDNTSDSSGEPSTAATPLLAEEDARLKEELQKDIDAILNTETEIVHSDKYIPGETYTGTAYYVSNDGDDMNDGRTPETAWRTLDRVLDANGYYGRTDLQPGDAVFFRRGDTFRMNETQEGHFDIIVSNLTFSTYGEGDKPIITGSSENGAERRSGNWSMRTEQERRYGSSTKI